MTYKQSFKFAGIIMGVFFIVVFAILVIDISNDVPYEELTLEEKVEKVITDAVGEETNFDKKRVVSISINEGVAKIVLNGDESLTLNLTRDSMLSKSKDVFEQLDKFEEITNYHLSWNMPLVDVKGNVKDGEVIKIVINKGHGITWENFNTDNFRIVAEPFFLHPAYQ